MNEYDIGDLLRMKDHQLKDLVDDIISDMVVEDKHDELLPFFVLVSRLAGRTSEKPAHVERDQGLPEPDMRGLFLVLSRIAQSVLDEPDDFEIIAEELDRMLDGLRSEDFFGTEGQEDPRGDFRDGEWSILGENIQGVEG